VHTQEEVIAIDRPRRRLTVCPTQDGTSYTLDYDKLVLSPGARPVRPPLPGIDSPGIFSIRTVPDSRAVRDWIKAKGATTAIVIGGGFIGLEMAENLTRLGITVSVIDRDVQIMPPMDSEMTTPLVQELELCSVQGTAVCGVFDLTVALTGASEKALQTTETDYGVVYAHPNEHVGYFPGATPIFINLLYDKSNGQVLGAQAVGKSGVERRIDVIAMAIQIKATVFDLEEAELCYAPQYGAAKDPVNMVGMISPNAMRGDLEITPWQKVGQNCALILDMRDDDEVTCKPIAGEIHILLNQLRQRLDELPSNRPHPDLLCRKCTRLHGFSTADATRFQRQSAIGWRRDLVLR
jgi:hypothetical protein